MRLDSIRSCAIDGFMVYVLIGMHLLDMLVICLVF